MARIDSFLRLVVEQKASDLHFHSGKTPIIRHNNDLVRLPFRTLSETETRRFVVEILDDDQKNAFEETQELDFIYVLPGVGRFRANAFVQRSGVGCVFRVIPEYVPTFEDLQLPYSLKKLAKLGNGLVLVTGPTGSGKSTTLAAIVNEINRGSAKHIISIEDPIEYLHSPIRCAVTQRQVGDHTASFSDALRSALREAPDVLVVGELRDPETIALALAAAETGVLVIGTLHTNTAAKAVNRMVDAVPHEARAQMTSALSVLLRGIVAQRLVKRASGDGRVAMFEILLHSWAVAHMIRENKIHQIEGYLQSVNYSVTGMVSLDTSIFNAVRDGSITLEEGMKASDRPEYIKSMCTELPNEEDEFSVGFD